MSGSIGEGMVDMGSNPTGDGRVVSIKRASANLIDMIEQMEIVGDYDVGNPIRQAAMKMIADGCTLAVQAATLRDTPEGAPV